MNDKPTQTFHIHSKILIRRIAYIAAVMAVVPLLVAFTGNGSSRGILPSLIIFELLVLLFMFWLMYSYIYVAVSPEGIRYRSLGYTIASTWENIAAIGERDMQAEGLVEGLLMREPGTKVNPLLKAGTRVNIDSRNALNSARDFIPLSMLFTKEWREGDIGIAIRRYAPKIFENPQA